MIYATDADDIEDIKNKLKNEASVIGSRQQSEHKYVSILVLQCKIEK